MGTAALQQKMVPAANPTDDGCFTRLEERS